VPATPTISLVMSASRVGRRVILSIVAAIVASVSVPVYRHHRAVGRLDEIMLNLVRLDGARSEFCMEQSYGKGLVVTQSDLDGTAGTAAYLTWPEGPVPGSYTPGVCGKSDATFFGGSMAPRTAIEWDNLCRHDPEGCGL
jgi:hypothetical protein